MDLAAIQNLMHFHNILIYNSLSMLMQNIFANSISNLFRLRLSSAQWLTAKFLNANEAIDFL